MKKKKQRNARTAVETMKTKTKMVRKKIMMKEMPQKGSEKKRRIEEFQNARTHTTQKCSYTVWFKVDFKIMDKGNKTNKQTYKSAESRRQNHLPSVFVSVRYVSFVASTVAIGVAAPAAAITVAAVVIVVAIAR